MRGAIFMPAPLNSGKPMKDPVSRMAFIAPGRLSPPPAPSTGQQPLLLPLLLGTQISRISGLPAVGQADQFAPSGGVRTPSFWDSH